ncbi:MAG: hypothetical protein GXY15_02450 [Candidatus Hydrogenedentes bacterium]|nr:hypothetical protein [Candidatus Hydrogenedentota bacterium]
MDTIRKRAIRRAFLGCTAVLLLMFGIAAVHESIPGLCEERDDSSQSGREYCPFCKLIHSPLVTSAPALLPAPAALPLPLCDERAVSPTARVWQAWQVRGPPLPA